MRRKWKIPALCAIGIVIIGVLGTTLIANFWNTKEIVIADPIISKINSEDDGLDLKTIIHETEKNVVSIDVETEHSSRTGSGFIYNNKGDIVTNAHVVKDAEVIYVRTANAHTYPAAVIGIGEQTDVALIRVPQLASSSYLSVHEENTIEIGDEIIALGSPHGFQNTVTVGIISGLDRNLEVDGYNYSNAYQISAQITHGNSGGPLIHRETGEVIGINAVGTEDGMIGFSIPISHVIDNLHQWSNEAVNEDLEIPEVDDRLENFNTDQLSEDAMYVIDYFFQGIKMRDYISSYTLFGSDVQAGLSYVDFRDSYIHYTALTYDDPVETIIDDHHVEIKVDVTTTSKTDDDKRKENKYAYTFTIGVENDQVKILSYEVD
ncbi:MAG TPA: trypsin-like peptidase domain-containing protein [Bacillota bacterium]|nr:trypsin-like peptidase domain-containing protein [Bacillota bacterium]